MRFFFITLIFLAALPAAFAQANKNCIGAQGFHFFKANSKPITAENDKAFATGIFYERYIRNGIKLKAGIAYFKSTFNNSYVDDGEPKGRASYTGSSKYVAVPILVAHNFIKESTDWEFFVGVGYMAFIHQETNTSYNHTTNATLRYNSHYTSPFFRNYFIAQVEGRYKLSKDILVGVSTTSYQLLNLDKKNIKGFPSLSIEGSIGYSF